MQQSCSSMNSYRHGQRTVKEGNEMRKMVKRNGILTEDDVGTIKPGSDNGGDEELRTVGVLACVSHR